MINFTEKINKMSTNELLIEIAKKSKTLTSNDTVAGHIVWINREDFKQEYLANEVTSFVDHFQFMPIKEWLIYRQLMNEAGWGTKYAWIGFDTPTIEIQEWTYKPKKKDSKLIKDWEKYNTSTFNYKSKTK